MNKRKKVLFVNEAHWISTGYSTYGKEVLPRIFNTGKYELAELAIYGHPHDPRGADAPWKVYGNMPVKPDPNYESYANQNGEYTFDKVCLDFKPDFVCLPPRELILTSHGYKPIELIGVGDWVMTHKGRFKKVVRVFKREYEGDLVLVKTKDSELVRRTTPEHPYLHSSNIYDVAYFAKAEDLKIGDNLFFNIKPTKRSSKNSFEFDGKLIEYNSDFFELMGFITGHSITIGKSIFVIFSKEYKGILERVQALFKIVFGVDSNILPYKNDNLLSCSMHITKVTNFLNKEIGKRAATKHCPSSIWRTSEENKKIFIQSIVYGKIKNEQLFKVKNNFRLTQEIRTLMLQLRSQVSIKKYGKSLWKIEEDKAVQFIEDFMYVKIREIKRESYKGFVYNLEVEEDNTYVYLDTIVHNCDIRDPWVYDFEERSPAREYFNWVVMPTCDSEPMDDMFVSGLKGADAVLTYSEYGQRLLEKECNLRLNLEGVASPCSEDFFKHVVCKPGHKAIYGLPHDSFVIGTVMRNQRRKLFPELLDMFLKLYDKCSEKEKSKIFLYFHTAWPDLGWDMPKILKEYGLGHKVFFSYFCNNCKKLQPSFYQDTKSVCRFCNQFACVTPNTGNGLSREDLVKVYNMFDVYVHYANSEGFGMPQVEAAYCGLPLLATDYSAMADISRNVGGFPIPVQKFYREPEGHTFKALPDNEWTAYKILELMRCDSLKEIGASHARLARNRYNWDRTAKVWMDVFDKLPIKNSWNRPYVAFTPNIELVKNIQKDSDFVNAILIHVANRPDMINSQFSANMNTWLINKTMLVDTREYGEKGKKEHPFDRNMAINICLDLLHKKENFEKQRSLHSRVS